jgi:putative ABC transport system permease protein
MSLSDAIVSALAALRLHKLRSALTMFGIVIGVAAVVAMIAVGGGAREQVMSQIRSMGTNNFVIWPGSVKQAGVRMGAKTAATLTDRDADAIASEVPEIQVTSPMLYGGVQVIAGGSNWATMLTGTDLGYFEVRDWPLARGRLFAPDEMAQGAQVALLGQTLARKLYGGADPIGLELRVRNVPFRIIGVMGAKGQSTIGNDQDDAVFIPLQTARKRIFGQSLTNARAIHFMYAKVREGESMAKAESDISALLRQRHRLQPDQENDFGIKTLADLYAAREQSARTLAFLLAAVAGISLCVGGIGIMNVMLVSVNERTREIGLRLAIGARRRDILRQFLFEALGLSAIGGAIGVVIGIGAAFLVARAVGWPLLIRIEGIVLAVAFSALVGIFFGWYPALRASRLDPIDALRHT